MRIGVTLFATLARYLPDDSREGTTYLEIPEGGTVRDVATALRIPTDLPRIVLVNDEDADDARPLHAGDMVTLFPPLAGGARLE